MLQKTTINYLPKLRRSSYVFYICLLLIVAGALASLPFIYTDISVKATGSIRPVSERTEVKSVISGIIDTLYYKEGDAIEKNAVVLRIKDPATKGKVTLNNFEITQREQFIHDLSLLTQAADFSDEIINQLQAPLYKEQASRFIHQNEDQQSSLKKAQKEVDINTKLAKDKVISSKEFFDVQNNFERIESKYKAFEREQLSNWQQDMARYRLELSQYRQQLQQVNTEAAYYEVRTPVAGIIQGIHTRYAGNLIQSNEVVCIVSPQVQLIGECYVQTKDIGLLSQGQDIRYQVEAFDYNYFGSLTGKIISIDNDFTVVNNTPFIKIRCSFDSSQLHLKNGFTGQLKKGLNFQARFMVARRSLWQLLFDRMDNWLNPNAPPQKMTAQVE
jgi:multidrug resistance efflux pump